MNRRHFLINSAMLLTALPLPSIATEQTKTRAQFVLTDKEWKRRLSKLEYAVMREESTERPGSSPLLNEKRDGIYHCKGCDLPLYPSSTKYDSGTGWPSFYQSLPDAIGTKEDNRLFATRTEVHCIRCESHLGHIFDDGPAPTGERHCLNGVSLIFNAA